MKKIGDRLWEVTESTLIQVGKPASPPTEEALAAIRKSLAGTGAARVYWFWMSIERERPHLGLAVDPPDREVLARVSRAVDSIWKRYSPENSIFDVVRLASPVIADLVKEHGVLLYESP